jgi:D-alanyl-D-alanine carboxypeptidase (penicillin-binding protein 5/6)
VEAGEPGRVRRPSRISVVIALVCAVVTLSAAASLGAGWAATGRPGTGGGGQRPAATQQTQAGTQTSAAGSPAGQLDPSPLTLRQTVPAAFTVPGSGPALAWPGGGQAAMEVAGLGLLGSSGPADSPAPIASIAKTMTAYLIVQDHPLAAGQNGPMITITAADWTTYLQEKGSGDSLAPVTLGERLSEREALYALMLSSADNMAPVLARWDSGTVGAFLARMNAQAAALGMAHTTFTDPSGLAASTTSTAEDLLKLGQAAIQLADFRQIVGTPQAVVPVAGELHNYNQLLGTDGIIGIKTGSTDAAGSCLLFAASVMVGGQTETIVGAVLGQRLGGSGAAILSPALTAARELIIEAEAVLITAQVAAPGATLATIDQGGVPTGALTVAEPLTVVGWPGLVLRVTVTGGLAAPSVSVTGAAGSAPIATELLQRGRPGALRFRAAPLTP